jgi:anti-sigma factor RsiW
MTDPISNIDPKEATEAKLCAYLEGELSPSERTEIEQHLAANPQHRQLLADLAKTREWMRSIPAESAPFDLAG